MTALLMVNGQPNPTGTGRYCLPPPGTCYCGACPHWRPIPEPDYREVVARLREAARVKLERRTRR